jgi:hypothetical protein
VSWYNNRLITVCQSYPRKLECEVEFISNESSDSEKSIQTSNRRSKHRGNISDSDSTTDTDIDSNMSVLMDSSQSSSVPCSRICASAVDAICNVSKIWLLFAKYGSSLSNIPNIVHRYHRHLETTSEFECIKMLFNTMFINASADDKISFTNTYEILLMIAVDIINMLIPKM